MQKLYKLKFSNGMKITPNNCSATSESTKAINYMPRLPCPHFDTVLKVTPVFVPSNKGLLVECI